MKPYIWIAITALLTLAGAIGITKVAKPALVPKNIGVRVVASFYPLYFFAQKIGGDKILLVNITPAGIEPHEYELSTRDIAAIEKSDLVILNGGIEPWADKIQKNLTGKKTVVVASRGLVVGGDPHVWLDPVLAKKQVAVIASSLAEVDPIHATFYESNARKLNEKLDTLDTMFRNGLTTCKLRTFVTSHASFGYVDARYNLKQLPIAGLSPDAEPQPRRLASLVQFAKDNKVTYIFFEELVSPKLAETIAREIGAKTLVLNPLEGLTKEQQDAGKDFISIQKENLENLKIALACQ